MTLHLYSFKTLDLWSFVMTALGNWYNLLILACTLSHTPTPPSSNTIPIQLSSTLLLVLFYPLFPVYSIDSSKISFFGLTWILPPKYFPKHKWSLLQNLQHSFMPYSFLGQQVSSSIF